MKKLIFINLILMLIFSSYSNGSEKAIVQIPRFNITINDVVFDNESALYPFIVHNDITYAPLTYNLSRELGVVTSWDSHKGLYLSKFKEDDFYYNPDLGGKYIKGSKYQASIPNFPVILNGININLNLNKTSYPVLIFRDITYLPLTWDNVYYEFAWDISWDNVKGLSINTNNNYDSGSILYLSEINNDYVLLQSAKDIFIKEKNEDGSIKYINTGKREIKEYKLNLKTNTLTYEGPKEEFKSLNPLNENAQEYENDSFTLSNSNILFNGQVIESINDIDLNNPELYVNKWEIDNVNFFQVTVYTNMEIPAPYTPFEKFLYQESQGNIEKVENWDSKNFLNSVYKINDDYYLCSNGRNISGRWSNNLGTILKINKEGKTEVINDLYKDYYSLRAIGVKNNKLIVEATWFGNPNIIDSKGKINAINDGFFYLEQNNSLSKIYPYIEGNVFLAPNEHLYSISTNRIFIIDLITGERIKI